ncbi:putative secreted protein [Wickerhamomyces ciferrii]|uniref:Secreted protein n=1 Tax=Wickerhamomyces ciferrii (strain ATCC 14091 / BCRC 22168 / CBS 111 / JCM 3599 / NBRC 0793 / NRRL Y-1031 F-60-10) TaxID=1206466 RepID=K0KIS1_WICCF|nr:uncharacterized protein BN7_4694 [Wickerhamomyces ciferrii]CCH45115.1 putative secreted protein [Wickerhamomyces ciferrii]
MRLLKIFTAILPAIAALTSGVDLKNDIHSLLNSILQDHKSLQHTHSINYGFNLKNDIKNYINDHDALKINSLTSEDLSNALDVYIRTRGSKIDKLSVNSFNESLKKCFTRLGIEAKVKNDIKNDIKNYINDHDALKINSLTSEDLSNALDVYIRTRGSKIDKLSVNSFNESLKKYFTRLGIKVKDEIKKNSNVESRDDTSTRVHVTTTLAPSPTQGN